MSEERPHYIGVPGFYNLNLACRVINEAFPDAFGCYLVGSSLKKRDYRDVDVRVIMDDADYERLFDGLSGNQQVNAKWNLMCVAISEWLASRTGLPIDFQIQKQSEANAEYSPKNGHKRNALGLFFSPREQP